MKERVTEEHIRSSIKRERLNIDDWKEFLGENPDPNHPLHDFAESVINHAEHSIELVNKKGIPQMRRYFASVLKTIGSFEENKPISEKAKILSEKYPDIPKYLSLLDLLPDQLAEKLTGAGALVMNYQADPLCYDDWENREKYTPDGH